MSQSTAQNINWLRSLRSDASDLDVYFEEIPNVCKEVVMNSEEVVIRVPAVKNDEVYFCSST